MNERLRCILCFIAGRLISGRDAQAIVELATGMTSQFHGELHPDRVDLTDLEEQTSIHAAREGHRLVVNDLRSGSRATLIVQENRFFGWDLGADQPYYGKVNESEIVIRQPADERAHRYLI